MKYRFLSLKPLFYGVVLLVLLSQHAHSQQSEADCAARADRAARDATSIAGGAVKGAAGGALFGAIVSDKTSRGAKRGAALGAVVGGASSSHNRNETYKRVYDDCMAGR
jgi:hypothetical protein